MASRWLVFCVSLAVACSSKTPGTGECDSNDDCSPGEICTGGSCEQICSSDADCTATGEICSEGICEAGSRENAPEITGIDADGVADSDPTHAPHRLAGRLTILGQYLDGGSVLLSDGTRDWPLEICGSMEGQLQVLLPEAMTDTASYTLSVTTQAGSCSAPLPVLQGETGLQGPAGSDGAPGVQGPRGDAGGGLALDLRFDEAGAVTTFADLSPYGNDATAPSGGLTSGATGHSGNAVDFSGGVITVTAPNTIPDSPQIWVEAWIAPDSVVGGTTRTVLVRDGSYVLQQVDGEIRFTVTGEANPSGGCMAASGGGLLVADDWNHVAGWYDGLSVSVAINGGLRATSWCPDGPVVASPTGAVQIGAQGGIEPFSGRIDDVRIWLAAPQSYATRRNVSIQTVGLTDGARHNSTLGSTGARGVPALTINKLSSQSRIKVEWSINMGVDNNNVQLLWRRDSLTGPIVNVAGASFGHTDRAGACSQNTGFFIYDTNETGPISFYLTYGRPAGTDSNVRMVINCASNESGNYIQSSSSFLLTEFL